jgi:hypothetical protein
MAISPVIAWTAGPIAEIVREDHRRQVCEKRCRIWVAEEHRDERLASPRGLVRQILQKVDERRRERHAAAVCSGAHEHGRDNCAVPSTARPNEHTRASAQD